MSDLREKIDLNAPAFGAGAQTLESLKEAPIVSVETVPVIQEEVVDDEPSVEENKVPYSRFKKYHDEAKEARADADRLRAELDRERTGSRPRYEATNDGVLPSHWVELYGDSDASKRAWKIQEGREQEIIQRAYEAGQRGAYELESQQREAINSNVATIDDNFEDLSSFVGREITAKEQSAILDIVDDYTAKDDDGNYQGAIMPFDKAWEIYELKQNSGKVAQRKDRDSVASLTANSSRGNADIQAEQDKSWNPLARGTWRSRL